MSRHAAAAVLDDTAFAAAPQPARSSQVRRSPRRRSVPVSPGRVRLAVVPEPVSVAPVTPPAPHRPVLRRAARAARSLL
ncbi:hypothetical protein, partial [Allokutzneria multivorans]|uniref:hypothetical protein n=1 Tax=Allokutzneria multivorans TaxID=1142134 RepID=UPI0031ED9396